MARYIDADALLERMRLTYCKDCNNYNEIMCRSCLMDDAFTTLEDCPAADVAPKSEVAREIFEEIETVLCRSVYPRVNANGTITPIISKDWHIRCDVYNAIKKKYTEGKE